MALWVGFIILWDIVIELRVCLSSEHFYPITVDIMPNSYNFVVWSNDVGIEAKMNVPIPNYIGISSNHSILITNDVYVIPTKSVVVSNYNITVAPIKKW